MALAQMACAGKLQAQGEAAGPRDRVTRHQAHGVGRPTLQAMTAVHSHGAKVKPPPSLSLSLPLVTLAGAWELHSQPAEPAGEGEGKHRAQAQHHAVAGYPETWQRL